MSGIFDLVSLLSVYLFGVVVGVSIISGIVGRSRVRGMVFDFERFIVKVGR